MVCSLATAATWGFFCFQNQFPTTPRLNLTLLLFGLVTSLTVPQHRTNLHSSKLEKPWQNPLNSVLLFFPLWGKSALCCCAPDPLTSWGIYPLMSLPASPCKQQTHSHYSHLKNTWEHQNKTFAWPSHPSILFLPTPQSQISSTIAPLPPNHSTIHSIRDLRTPSRLLSAHPSAPTPSFLLVKSQAHYIVQTGHKLSVGQLAQALSGNACLVLDLPFIGSWFSNPFLLYTSVVCSFLTVP